MEIRRARTGPTYPAHRPRTTRTTRTKRIVAAVCGLLTAVCVPSLSACAESASPEATVPRVGAAAAEAAVATVRAEDVLHRVSVLAHDSMRGRPTPSPELDAAAAWLAAEFAAMGLEPGVEGEFIQRYPVPDEAAPASATPSATPGPPPVTAAGPRTAPNVVAILEGSDPLLRDEYVVFSAHMDHVGVGEPDASGDSIYNGADDDASGTAVMLEVAEALASLEPRPRRSALFVIVSGEEQGLWGSRYFVEHPPVPLEAMVAGLNADMVGRNWSDTIVAIGREHSELGRVLDEVQTAHPELGMTAIDDVWPEERFYERSDHFEFARRGVPVLFFFNGVHDDYHRPSDEVDRLDVEKAARIGRLLVWLGLGIADRPQRPEWNAASRRRIVDRSP